MSKNPKILYKSFQEFYPFYLSQHQNPVCIKLHLLGAFLATGFCSLAFLLSMNWLFILAVVCGYGCAWVGHFFFEKNRPATFQYPLYSLFGDLRMTFEYFLKKF